ncbi:MAG: hypothetical protein RL011_1933 [Pseudomonadota bacterium]
MGRVGIFAGSFDPPTYGHIDLIERATQLVDHLVIGIGASEGKVPLFSTDERIALIKSLGSKLKNISVETYSGLTVDFATRVGATVSIRGVRSAIDYDYEMRMALMNQTLKPDLQTLFLPTRAEFSHVSSTLAKEIARHGGACELLVPGLVARALKRKFAP